MPDLGQILRRADKETLTEIIREAEAYLNAQMTAAIAADQRAVTFAGILAAATAVAGAGTAALLTGESPNPYIIRSGVFLCTGLILSMICATVAARPVDFEFPGNDPSSWSDDIEAKISLEHSLAAQSVHYSEMIAENNKCMRQNNRWMTASIFSSVISLILAGIAAMGAA